MQLVNVRVVGEGVGASVASSRRELALTQRRPAPQPRLAARACADCARSSRRPLLRLYAAPESRAESTHEDGAPPPLAPPPDTPTAADSVPVAVALALLSFYRKQISPLLPSSCRFVPSCSVYSIQAFKTYGFWKGGLLTAWRLARCNPLNPAYGLDLPRWPPFGPADEQ